VWDVATKNLDSLTDYRSGYGRVETMGFVDALVEDYNLEWMLSTLRLLDWKESRGCS
jgi:hypothetical protein